MARFDWIEVIGQNLFSPRLWPELCRKACNRFRGAGRPAEYLLELESLSRPWDDVLLTLFDEERVRQTIASMEELKAFAAELQERESRCPVKLGGGAHTELLYSLTRILAPDTVVETGVAYGWSSAVILLALDNLGAGRLYSSDLPYPGIPHAGRYAGWVVPERLRERWTLLSGPDRNNLPELLEKVERVDLFHYDSDKSYNGRMWAYRLVWPHLASGGIFVSDDIQDNRAFLDFCEEADMPAHVMAMSGKYVGLCRKRS